jgi:hypothetical protein
MILGAEAADKVWVYNRTCLHYDLVAREVYTMRDDGSGVFERGYLAYVIAGLVTFDLGRQMGKGNDQRYLPEEGGFADRLRQTLDEVRPHLEPLMGETIEGIELEQAAGRVEMAYEILSRGGSSGLHAEGKEFHVGATRVLGFLNPHLFITIDGPAAKAFAEHHDVEFKAGIQPGYSWAKYLDCLSHAQNEIRHLGPEFQELEPGTPSARLFDKVAHITGQELAR